MCIRDSYRLGDDIQSKVRAFAFGLSAEIERNLISQRTKEALARLKKEVHQVGRGQGPVSYTHLDVYKRQIRSFIVLLEQSQILF